MKTKHKVGIASAAAMSVLVPFSFWLAGFNFDERGGLAFACATCTIISMVFVMAVSSTYPEQ